MQATVAARNAQLDQFAAQAGDGAMLRGYTGGSPGAANAATGTLQFTITNLTWGASSNGQKTATGTSDANAAAGGTPGYVRLLQADGATAVADFPAGVGTGEASLDAPVSAGGIVNLASFTLTAGNA